MYRYPPFRPSSPPVECPDSIFDALYQGFDDLKVESESTPEPFKERNMSGFYTKLDSWGEEDLLTFYKVLKEHCPYMIYPNGLPLELCQEIHKALPDRTVEEIGNVGAYFCRVASKQKWQEDRMADKWHDLAEGLTPHTMGVKECFETGMRICKDEPGVQVAMEKENTNGVPTPKWDLLYEYLACCFEERPRPELGEVEQVILRSLFGDVVRQGAAIDDEEAKSYLRDVYRVVASPNSTLQSGIDSKTFLQIYNTAKPLNPFGIHSSQNVLGPNSDVSDGSAETQAAVASSPSSSSTSAPKRKKIKATRRKDTTSKPKVVSDSG